MASRWKMVRQGKHLVPAYLVRLPASSDWRIASYWGFGLVPPVDGLAALDGSRPW